MPSRRSKAPIVPGTQASASRTIRALSSIEKLRRWRFTDILGSATPGFEASATTTVVLPFVEPGSIRHASFPDSCTHVSGGCRYHVMLTYCEARWGYQSFPVTIRVSGSRDGCQARNLPFISHRQRTPLADQTLENAGSGGVPFFVGCQVAVGRDADATVTEALADDIERDACLCKQ